MPPVTEITTKAMRRVGTVRKVATPDSPQKQQARRDLARAHQAAGQPPPPEVKRPARRPPQHLDAPTAPAVRRGVAVDAAGRRLKNDGTPDRRNPAPVPSPAQPERPTETLSRLERLHALYGPPHHWRVVRPGSDPNGQHTAAGYRVKHFLILECLTHPDAPDERAVIAGVGEARRYGNVKYRAYESRGRPRLATVARPALFADDDPPGYWADQPAAPARPTNLADAVGALAQSVSAAITTAFSPTAPEPEEADEPEEEDPEADEPDEEPEEEEDPEDETDFETLLREFKR